MTVETNLIPETKNLEVVVGIEPKGLSYANQWKERYALAQKIHDVGFTVHGISCNWPRDHYVLYNGRYVLQKNALQFGEGGCFHSGEDFLLVSERVFNEKYTSAKPEIEEEAKNYYPKARFHSVPTGYNPLEVYKSRILRHTDLTCLLIPSKKLLFVDENFYENEFQEGHHARTRFERIAERENLSLVFYQGDPETSFKYYPANCLVLPLNNGEVVFVNGIAKEFVKLLEKHNLNVVEVEMCKTPRKRGSIRCCTNVKLPETHLRDIIEWEW